MSDFLKKFQNLSWEEYWEEYNKISKAFTKQELPKNHRIIFDKIVNPQSFSKKSKSKQVVIKNIANMEKLRMINSLKYIIRNSDKSFAINEKGEEVSYKEIMKDWRQTFSTRADSKEAWHLVFSVDEYYLSDKNIKALEQSVKETMDFNFFGHKYVMALHTHQAKPHIHIILNKYNFLEHKRLHFQKKSDIRILFNNLRNDFSYALKARGLNYENKNPLEKDLRLQYLKLQRPQKNLAEDTKFAINEIFQDINESLNKKIQNKNERIKHLKAEYDLMKKTSLDLDELLQQYIKHKNKKRYALFKKIKEHSKEMRYKAKELITETKALKNLHLTLDYSKEKYKNHYKEQVQSIIQKRNFLQTYEGIYPRHKGASKKDIQNYYRIKKSIIEEEKQAENKLKLYSQNFYKDVSLENANLFKLEQQYKKLDEAIYLLKNAEFFLKEASEPYVKELEKNKSFIKELCEKRFQTIEKSVLEKEFGKDNFLLKEYNKSCEFLGKENKMKINLSSEKKTFSSSYERIQEKYNSKSNTKSNSNSKPLNNNSNRGFER